VGTPKPYLRNSMLKQLACYGGDLKLMGYMMKGLSREMMKRQSKNKEKG